MLNPRKRSSEKKSKACKTPRNSSGVIAGIERIAAWNQNGFLVTTTELLVPDELGHRYETLTSFEQVVSMVDHGKIAPRYCAAYYDAEDALDGHKEIIHRILRDNSHPSTYKD